MQDDSTPRAATAKAQHTPGPWGYVRLASGINVFAVSTSRAIADLRNYSFGEDVTEANARLIAAAPDLLAALETALPILEGHHEALDHDWHVEPNGKPGDPCESCDAIAQARAAIAQAKGEVS